MPQCPCLKQILLKRRFFSFSLLSRRNSKESIHLESEQSFSQLESSGGPSDPNMQAV